MRCTHCNFSMHGFFGEGGARQDAGKPGRGTGRVREVGCEGGCGICGTAVKLVD